MKIKRLILSLLVTGSIVSSANAAQVAYATNSATNPISDMVDSVKDCLWSNNQFIRRNPGNCPPCKVGLALASALISYLVVPSKTINKMFGVPEKSDLDNYIMSNARRHHENMKKTKANLLILTLRAAGTVAAYRILNSVAWYKLLQ
ncbi:MAG: hypothetical protein P4L22_03265 [Candidatus Babeliales bacterium]|nr:hypothetical protein [Candidatus Babeliales bacterium]